MSARTLELVVTAVRDTAPDVRAVTLADPDGNPLPGYVPGSHLVLALGEQGEWRNAYSLTGDGVAPATYDISVLHVPGGAGGSDWLHRELRPGMRLTAQLPRSAFAPVARARRHLLIAGGIGVTPIVSHLHAARRWGREVQVLYAFRPGRGAHLDDLETLTAPLPGPGVETCTDRDMLLARLSTVLRGQPVGTHLYVCGPGAMIDAVLSAAGDAGWPASRLHSERFGVDALDPGEPFTLTVTRGGVAERFDVPSGVSLLETLERHGVDVPNMCRQGVCGECRLPVTGGTPLHRDLFLGDDEKAAGEAVMACVSRADGPTLEVSL
ncbi:ferredoxin [Saccharomonospora sp. CUA-673]|uniref:PDR/VanB family oxidoreductase n=1 Tax=Saccharomonospora sp. CUA-673 TaxID=1904969 RepID=UPI00095C6A15|nr:PDR/VanB family oxidoreductase [Saccharomonospora sp. CUA-673]OLT49259.1 ferredoxin [Saccharomonospora sp. CUA-673]